jgi:hypothetical protein
VGVLVLTDAQQATPLNCCHDTAVDMLLLTGGAVGGVRGGRESDAVAVLLCGSFTHALAISCHAIAMICAMLLPCSAGEREREREREREGQGGREGGEGERVMILLCCSSAMLLPYILSCYCHVLCHKCCHALAMWFTMILPFAMLGQRAGG